MPGEFENYNDRKAFWFWIMLSIGDVVSNDPKLAAKKSDFLVKSFIDSPMFRILFDVDVDIPFYGHIKNNG